MCAQFDLIYWLGDLPTHHVWNQSQEDHLDVHRVFFQLLAKYFPNTRVYSTVGERLFASLLRKLSGLSRSVTLRLNNEQ